MSAERSHPYSQPLPLTQAHDTAEFDSGEPTLDDWLRRRALQNAALGASRTYVVCSAGSAKVVGYFSLSMGQLAGSDALGSMRRNMPKEIPAVLLGRLAVDRAHQGQSIGTALVEDAARRALLASVEVSARLLLVHAISPAAEAFYSRHGFKRLPGEAPNLALDLVNYRII